MLAGVDTLLNPSAIFSAHGGAIFRPGKDIERDQVTVYNSVSSYRCFRGLGVLGDCLQIPDPSSRRLGALLGPLGAS